MSKIWLKIYLYDILIIYNIFFNLQYTIYFFFYFQVGGYGNGTEDVEECVEN